MGPQHHHAPSPRVRRRRRDGHPLAGRALVALLCALIGLLTPEVAMLPAPAGADVVPTVVLTPPPVYQGGDSVFRGHVGLSFSTVISSPDSAATMSVDGALPTGVSFDPATNTISGQFVEAGYSPVVIHATDGVYVNSRAVSFDVSDQPWFVTDSSLTVGLRQPVSSTVQVAGADVTSMTTSGTLPPGISFTTQPAPSGSPGVSGRLIGSATETGTWTFEIDATTSMGAVAQSFVLTVNGPQYLLNGVDCPAADSCVGVGGISVNGTGDHASNHSLVERWDGSSWAVQVTPDAGNLDAVSCPSADFCVAVGTSIMTWDGTTWKIVSSTPDEAGAISCPTTDYCAVVGRSGWLAQWNGATWSTATSLLAGVTFRGVSCFQPSSCTLVGNTSQLAGLTSVIGRWDGSSFVRDSGPVAAQGNLELSAVSCPEASFCMATGYAIQGGYPFVATRALRWNGTGWEPIATPNVTVRRNADAGVNGLLGVSCSSSTACTGIGGSLWGLDFTTSADLVEEWDGTAWTTASVAGVDPSVGGVLTGISCAGHTRCVTVGYQSGVACACVTGAIQAPRVGRPVGRPAKKSLGIFADIQIVNKVAGTWSSSVGSIRTTIARLHGMTTSLPPAARGHTYTAQLESAGGLPAIRWSALGTWPSGITLASDGRISGYVPPWLKAKTYVLKAAVHDESPGKQMKATVKVALVVG